jgi:hypothetical protein
MRVGCDDHPSVSSTSNLDDIRSSIDRRLFIARITGTVFCNIPMSCGSSQGSSKALGDFKVKATHMSRVSHLVVAPNPDQEKAINLRGEAKDPSWGAQTKRWMNHALGVPPVRV